MYTLMQWRLFEREMFESEKEQWYMIKSFVSLFQNIVFGRSKRKENIRVIKSINWNTSIHIFELTQHPVFIIFL